MKLEIRERSRHWTLRHRRALTVVAALGFLAAAAEPASMHGLSTA